MIKYLKSHNLFHQSFMAGLVIKGVDGILEIAGGILAIFLNPIRLNKMILYLTRHELSEDPRDFIANSLLRLANEYSVSAQIFNAAYLLSHGLIKIFLIISLWRKKAWAYPWAIIFFSLFMIYQMYRYYYTHSAALIILSIFDMAVIILTWLEYKKYIKFPADANLM